VDGGEPTGALTPPPTPWGYFVRKWNGFIGLAGGRGAKIYIASMGVAPKILVLCRLAAGWAGAGVPRRGGRWGFWCRDVVLCGSLVVRVDG
jgi:hypothetical protein